MKTILIVTLVLYVAASQVVGQNGHESTDSRTGTKVRVAAISFVPKKFDLSGNAARLEQAFRQAQRAIPPATETDTRARDQVEAEFLAWREQEMPRRYQHAIEKLEKTRKTVTRDASGPDPVMMGAYYYPWYRNRRNAADDPQIGWMSRALRGRLQPRQLPQLGVYNSRDKQVISDHIAQSIRGNIALWAVSWWGPDHATDRTFREDILGHPDAAKLKYAVLYESTGRLGSFEKPNYTNLLPDFEYLAQHYFQHSNYLKIDGKPVVFLYLTREYFRNRGLQPLAELRKKYPQLYLVGDEVFGPRYREQDARLWDAITAYDVYGQSLQMDGATRAAIDRLKSNYTNARTIAHRVQVAFIPAISPGYNDRAVRDGHAGRGRFFTDAVDSEEGDVFRSMIRDVAIPLADDRANRIIMVTSFNEWYEDTQVEATSGTAGSTTKDDSASGKHYTQDNRYFDYGYLYLDILREETQVSTSSISGSKR